MDSERLQLPTQRRGAWLIVQAHGRIDSENTAALRTCLRRALADHPLIVLDLSGARLTDAAGVAVLVCVHHRAIAYARVFLVVAPDDQVREVLRVTGLDQRLLICPMVDDFQAWSGRPSRARPRAFTRP